MTKASHTPGPWVVNYKPDDEPYIIAEQGKAWDNPVICSLYEDVTPEDSITFSPWLKAYPNAEANARLIAAAPDMLAALEDAEKEMRGWSWTGNARDKGPYDEHLARIRTAIAKAKGT
ncbi:MAG: hypothetical protein ACK5PR_03330 [bacterium]|jgi:hypothetical protein